MRLSRFLRPASDRETAEVVVVALSGFLRPDPIGKTCSCHPSADRRRLITLLLAHQVAHKAPGNNQGNSYRSSPSSSPRRTCPRISPPRDRMVWTFT